jgi:hypothetical protein
MAGKLVRIRQGKQARSSEAYNDANANGPIMETDPENLEQDLNNLRSQVNRILDRSLTGNWYDEPASDLNELFVLASRRYTQALSGAINNVNRVFTTAEKFRHDGIRDESFYYNGQQLQEGAGNDYVVSESVPGLGYDTITTEFTPRNGANPDQLWIDYTPF